jgi:hypothetical protein
VLPRRKKTLGAGASPPVNTLLSVHTEDSGEAKRAKEIFERNGAEDISTAGEASVKNKDDRTRTQYRKAA